MCFFYGSISMLPVYSMHLLYWISLHAVKAQISFINQKDKCWKKKQIWTPAMDPQTLSHIKLLPFDNPKPKT